MQQWKPTPAAASRSERQSGRTCWLVWRKGGREGGKEGGRCLTSHGPGDVRELERSADVAHSKDVLVRRAQVRIDLDAVPRVEVHASLVEPEALDVGLAASGNQ